MQVWDYMKKYRAVITFILAASGIAVMAYYDSCDTECSYLQGDIWGIDLKWIGIAYMAVIICLTALKWTPLIRAALAAGLGVEVFLISFQVQEEVFCPFCLAFSILVLAAFAVNYELSDRIRGTWQDKILYALGEFTWPPVFKPRIPLILFSLLGYLFVFFTFTGSATPAYADAGRTVPSSSQGKYEVIIFSDYFCAPCQALEMELEQTLETLLAREGKRIRITFVDTPIHKQTALFNRYYLYAVNAKSDIRNALRIRVILFHHARQLQKTKTATVNEEDLAVLFRKKGITFKPFDYRPVQAEYNRIFKRYGVDGTPLCIIKYSENDFKRYQGPKAIMEGMKTLSATLNK
ncbi:MAG: thioredoxin domain-containing protein [Deltaproteobacteria bacterium]|nr:thioredoxin domain-containing protein [Deltaproteobacteria bacterium]